MDTLIPSAEDIRGLLLKLSTAQVRILAAQSGVPFTTLWKARSGETKNPGIETVRQFLPHLKRAAEPDSLTSTATIGALSEQEG